MMDKDATIPAIPSQAMTDLAAAGTFPSNGASKASRAPAPSSQARDRDEKYATVGLLCDSKRAQASDTPMPISRNRSTHHG